MENDHSIPFDAPPKRRKHKDNPYTIRTSGIHTDHPRYFLEFQDGRGVTQFMELSKELYETFFRFSYKLHVRKESVPLIIVPNISPLIKRNLQKPGAVKNAVDKYFASFHHSISLSYLTIRHGIEHFLRFDHFVG